MSNLLKSFSLVCKDDKRIIDSNEAITIKLQEIRSIMTEDENAQSEFTLGINPEDVSELLSDGENPKIISSIIKNTEENEENIENIENMLETANEQAEQIITNARKEAEKILQKAKSEANDIMSKAREEGFKKGVTEGKNSVEEEKERLNAEYREKEEFLENDYMERRKKMEPELVDVITEVFASVTKALSEDQKDMILALVDKVLSGTEANNNYIIKACKEDAEFLRENKDNILRNINRDINLEIVEDVSMHRNECLIDTDLGIYDCSLDIQLENLIRAIKILACAMEY